MESSGEKEDRRVKIRIENNDYQPRYVPHDEIIVDPEAQPRTGEVWMVILGDDLLFRRIVSLGEEQVSFALPNDEFRHEVIKKSSPARLVLWGRVTGFFRVE